MLVTLRDWRLISSPSTKCFYIYIIFFLPQVSVNQKLRMNLYHLSLCDLFGIFFETAL